MARHLAALCAASLLLVPVLASQEEKPDALFFGGEPIGSEYPVARGLAADAADLLAADATIPSSDAGAAMLQQGRLVRAFAEALRAEEAADPVIAARSHARRALILARLGAVNFAAEHANAALPQPAVRGEVMLARAWMFWHTGELAAADRDAARATGAPAWALAEWQAHCAQHAATLTKFSATPEPGDPYSADFLAYAELAAAARAYTLADGLYFRAVNNLQQQFDAEQSFSPANLQRARRGFRDLIRTLLGESIREPGAVRLAAMAVAAAREVCITPAPLADWENLFSLLADVRATQPDFDFAHHDLHGDLARAESEAGLGLAWREKLKPLLADPRLRLASRVHQALARLEAHRAPALLNAPLDTRFTPDQLASLTAYRTLVETEDAVLARLYQELPADSPAVPRAADYVVAVAKLRYRLALLEQDPAEARLQLAKLEQFPNTDPAISLEAYRAQLTALERNPFHEAHAQLLRYPPTDVPEKHLAAALAAATDIAAQLSALHGDAYLSAGRLPADSVALVQRLCHLRIVNALSTGHVFSAERALTDLQRWCVPGKHPAFAPLPDLLAAVADLPAQDEKFTAAEQQIWNLLNGGKADPAFPAQIRAIIGTQPDRFAPRILLPLAHWRLCEDNLAAAAIEDTKKIVRRNKATRAALDSLAANNDPVRVVRGLCAALQAAPAAERSAKIAATTQALDGLLRHLAQVFSGGQTLNPTKLPADARRAYTFCLAGLVHVRAAEQRLPDACGLLASLRQLSASDALALAQPAVADLAFTHDLPDANAVRLWHDLLQATPLSDEEHRAFVARMDPFLKKSLSVQIAALASGLRRSRWADTRTFIASLHQNFGSNRALARQLDVLNACITDCLPLDRPPETPELDRRRRAHVADEARAKEEQVRMAVSWENAPEAFKENWDRTGDRRQLGQLADERKFHQDKIDAIDAEKAELAKANYRAIQARLAQAFRDLNALAQL
ncbi:MAG: hypothetical protein QG602_398 [Verrucomicrobiota bacterium]|nr:hypothetical protein [Verrucomicrobiota bacterium]